mgnify:CR=1 FL=1
MLYDRTPLRGETGLLSQISFATKKEAEEYRDLALYAMKVKYGKDQTMFDFEIFEQQGFL